VLGVILDMKYLQTLFIMVEKGREPFHPYPFTQTYIENFRH